MASKRPGGPAVLFLTGAPGAGKTTLIERVARGLAPEIPRGFLTREMVSEDGRRWGFRVETFEGRSVVIAHQRVLSRDRVGRYGVDVRAINRLAERELGEGDPHRVVLIDEVRGLMCLAPRFVSRLQTLVDSGHPLVATLARTGPPLVMALRRRPDVEVWEVTEGNRSHLADAVLGWIASRSTPEERHRLRS